MNATRSESNDESQKGGGKEKESSTKGYESGTISSDILQKKLTDSGISASCYNANISSKRTKPMPISTLNEFVNTLIAMNVLAKQSLLQMP